MRHRFLIIWQHDSDGQHYEVRTAGHSIRLYRNGVFHSQYNGQRLFNGGVWDMLWLPLCFRPVARIRRVLMLGVGGGAALKKIHDFFPSAQLTGVDLDADHLRIARRFVGLRGARVKLIEADACQWLRAAGRRQYDIIIDDLFTERDGEPCRAVAFEDTWLELLRRRLHAQGVLIANCVSLPEARPLVARYRQQSTAGFAHGYSLQQSGFENVVAALAPAPLHARELKARFDQLAQGRSRAGLPGDLRMRKLA